jgi:hypothetical protein
MKKNYFKLKQGDNMKYTIKKVVKSLKSVKGSSLAEFATTTALMATLAATAAPKLSELSEGTKGEKSVNELDKLKALASNYYQETASVEGRGRFPGQGRYDMVVGGANHGERSVTHSSQLHDDEIKDIEDDLFGPYDEVNETFEGGQFNDFEDEDHSKAWLSVFGLSAEANLPESAVLHADDQPSTAISEDEYDVNGAHADWLYLTNNEVLESPFQDGHFIYRVVPGYKPRSGAAVPPMIFLADLENPSDFNTSLAP